MRHLPTLPDILGGHEGILDVLGVHDPIGGPADGAGFASIATAIAHALPAGAPEPDGSDETGSGDPTDPAPEPKVQAAGAPGLAFDAFGELAAAKGGAPGPGGNGGGKGGGKGGEGSGDPSVLSEYHSGAADGDAGFDILIAFKGSAWTGALQQAFIQAADYFTTVITEDTGGGATYRGTFIDDLYVSAELTAIDGPGGILGQAGPRAVWTGIDLTAMGIMQFDTADALTYEAAGLWDDIVTHELMHVLGFGSLWDYNRNLAPYDPLTGEYQYIGAAGLDAYQRTVDPDATFIPVESSGFGPGTDGAHWDEDALDSELMTGFIDGNNALSEFSVMSLADLGYQIDYQDYPYDDFVPLA